MPEPDVSVIIPMRNRPTYIGATVASILAQTHPAWEAIVVDDRSTDDSVRRTRDAAAGDERVRVIERPEDAPAGAPSCRNIGFDAATGRYVIFMDSDDLLGPDALEHRVRFMDERPELDFAVFRQMLFDHDPSDARYLFTADTGEDDLDRFLGCDNPWQTMGPIWRRGALERVGPWDTSLVCGQDVDQHTRALIEGLRGGRADRYDCYFRSPRDKRSRVSENVMAPAVIDSQLRRLRKALSLLIGRGMRTEKRERLIAASFLAYAESCGDGGDRRRAAQIWSEAGSLGLIGPRRRWLGARYLRWRGSTLGAAIFGHMRRRWPDDFFLGDRDCWERYTPDEAASDGRRPITDRLHRYHRYQEAVVDGPMRFLLRRMLPSRLLNAVARRAGSDGDGAASAAQSERSNR